MNFKLISYIKITGIALTIVLFLFQDFADAQYGTRRRERRRTAIVVSSATHEKDEQEYQQQQQQQQTQSTQNQQQTKDGQTTSTTSTTTTTTTTSTTPPPSTTKTADGQLAIGTVSSTLPDGCEPTAVDNVEYYHCGANWYRTAYQGNNLVYVTTDPPKQ